MTCHMVSSLCFSSSVDEGLSVEPPAGHRRERIQLRGRSEEESLPLTPPPRGCEGGHAVQYVASVLCEAGCRRQRGWEAGPTLSRSRRETRREGPPSPATRHRGVPPSSTDASWEATRPSPCVSCFFYKTCGSTVFLLLSCYRVHPTARKQAAPERKTGKTSACV